VVRILSRFNSLLNQQIGSTASSVRSLYDLGVSVESDGSLSFDSVKFQTAIDTHPQEVQDFFTTATTGFGATLTAAVNNYTDSISGSITLESKATQSSIDAYNTRIDDLTAILQTRQINLIKKFNHMEEILAGLNSQQSALGSLTGAIANAKATTSK
jgi:flagellar hook-associated protein 2